MKVLHPILSDSRVEIDAKKLDDVLAKARAYDEIWARFHPNLEHVEMGRMPPEGMKSLLLGIWASVFEAYRTD